MESNDRLKCARESRGLSVDTIASLLHVQKKTYEEWENGERSIKADDLLMIADTLAISIDFLLGKTPNPFLLHEERQYKMQLTSCEKWVIEIFRSVCPEYQRSIALMAGKMLDYQEKIGVAELYLPEIKRKPLFDHCEDNIVFANFNTSNLQPCTEETQTKQENLSLSSPEEKTCKTTKSKTQRMRARVKIAVDERGKAVYKWANGYTQEELEAHKKQIRLEYGVSDSGKFRVIKTKKAKEDCKTFSGYALQWYSLYKAPHIRESTKEMYENCFNTHIFPAIGFRPISEITSDELQEFILGYSASSSSLVDKIMMILRQVFNAALEDGIIKKSPIPRLKPPEGKTNERMPLTTDEVNELIKSANAHEYGLLPLLLLYTGVRRGEAIGLKWEDVNNGKLCIRRAVYYEKSNTVIVGETKTKAGHREIPILPALEEVLSKCRAGHSGQDYIFGNGAQPMPYSTFKRHWTRLQTDIPVLKGVSPHRLRHTYLMLLRHSGVEAVTQQYLMGHSDFDTTANIYTHIDNNDVFAAGDKFNNGLKELLTAYTLKPIT